MTEQINSSKPRIGFIGVGVMGRPMVSNLLKAGFPCTIYDVNPIPVEALVAEGATSANSAAEVAKGSDIFSSWVVLLTNSTRWQASRVGTNWMIRS